MKKQKSLTGGRLHEIMELPMRKALTLLEMMVAVGIILILSAVAYPLFNSYEARNTVRQAARLLAADLGRTEEEARRIGLSGTINAVPGYSASLVSVAAGGTVIFSDLLPANVNVAGTPAAALNNGSGAAALQFPSGAGAVSSLVFNPQGIPIYSKSFPSAKTETLTVQDNRGNRAVVTVDLYSGAVSGP